MCCLHTALLNIYFEFICNVDAVKLSIFAARKGLVPTTAQALDQALGWGVGWRKLCPFQMSILINTFVACL